MSDSGAIPEILKQSLLKDFRENYALGMEHGIQRGLGMAADIAYACLDDVTKLGKSSHGYRLAILDISHRLLLKMKEDGTDRPVNP